MRDMTIKALKVLRGSKVLSLDREAFDAVVDDLRQRSTDELWSATEKPAKPPRSAPDSTLVSVKAALSRYKAPIATKAQRLSEFLIPDREGAPPKTMPAALKILRAYFSDAAIVAGARELMNRLRAESGTDVPL